jgi:ornithine cyclodeaminase/alanine dehydrogenase-like protein (mu-crystallin family)
VTAVTQGTALMPPRTIPRLIDGSGYLGSMPESASDPRVYGVKIVSLHPANPEGGRPAIQGLIALFDQETGLQ